MADTIDMSLDDIIKMKKQSGRPVSARGGRPVSARGGRGGRGRGRGAMRSDQILAQQRAAATTTVGVSPLNRSKNRLAGQQQQYQQVSQRGQRSRGQQARGQRGRGQGIRGQGIRGQGIRGQGTRGQGTRGQGAKRQGTPVLKRHNFLNQRAAIRQKRRETLVNQQRGVQVPNEQQNFSAKANKKNKPLRRPDPRQSVMMITLSNTEKKTSNDVQLMMGGRKQRTKLTRTTTSGRGAARQGAQSPRTPITLITTQNTTSSGAGDPLRISSAGSTPSPNAAKNKKRKLQAKLKLQREFDRQQQLQQVEDDDDDSEVVVVGRKRQQPRQKLNRGSNTSLQLQIKEMKPSVKQKFKFQRMDFAKARTGMSLNDRFSSVDSIPIATSQEIHGRQVLI